MAFAYDAAIHLFHCLHRLREEEATTNATAFRGKNIYLHSTLDTTQFLSVILFLIVVFLKPDEMTHGVRWTLKSGGGGIDERVRFIIRIIT